MASASPRRRELLTLAGFSFTVCAADADETLPPDLAPADAVQLLAKRKAVAVAAAHPNAAVLGADTLVVLDGAFLGKPQDDREAAAMLRRLSGHMHTVCTGVCIQTPSETQCFAEQTQVQFFPLSDAEIAAYVATGEPLDKAGAYGIQGVGCTLVERIDGDYYTVVGLPIGRVARAVATAMKNDEC